MQKISLINIIINLDGITFLIILMQKEEEKTLTRLSIFLLIRTEKNRRLNEIELETLILLITYFLLLMRYFSKTFRLFQIAILIFYICNSSYYTLLFILFY